MFMHCRAAALFGALCLLSGCLGEIPYEKIGEETHYDDKSGNFIRTTRWEYDDGLKVTTTTILPPLSGNDDRRTEPQRRIVSFDFF